MSFFTPIVFIVFNRPEHAEVVFKRIAAVRPERLLLIADGPRADRPGEDDACARVREIVQRVDWPCQMQTNFAEANMGCRQRIVSGLNWAFELVEEAIILEDDILPDPSFFPFCEQMLDRHRGDSRISMIAGLSLVAGLIHSDDSYYFSRLTHIWGWATWRSAWARYDGSLTNWEIVKHSGLFANLFPAYNQRLFWSRIFDRMHQGTGPDTWDYQWAYTNFLNHALAIVPCVNLIENIGFGPGATHTVSTRDLPNFSIEPMSFPIRHPPAMIVRHDLDRLDSLRSEFFVRSFGGRVIRKLRRVLSQKDEAMTPRSRLTQLPGRSSAQKP